MRAALLKQWPALTRFYRLMPWDLERLTEAELTEYVTQLSDYNKAQAKAERDAKRR